MTWNYKCKCRLDASACNNKQLWNKDKCRYERKELFDKRISDKGFILNPSTVNVSAINLVMLENT